MSFTWVFRRRWQRLVIVSIVLLMIFLSILSSREGSHSDDDEPASLRTRYPLLWEHVHTSNVIGGAFYIPPTWMSDTDSTPHSVVEAALLASRLTKSNANRSISHSEIPLIIHQTWKNTQIDTWPEAISDSVERWLEHAVEAPMAYLMWDDDGVIQFLEEFEPSFIDRFSALARNVERSDVFRIMVANYIGGVYGDVDTHPLRSPATWIESDDVSPWHDPESGHLYNSTEPVRLIVGLEADCSPDSDSYWRMGYTHPVQLTQWALAGAPHHPVLSRFMDRLYHRLDVIAERHEGNLSTPAAYQELYKVDPLILTGPDAVTVATKSWLEETAGLRWNALTGLYDGGKSKLVGDVMVLPITGFSPGRGTYGNMGSRAPDDRDARLQHLAQGSWRSFDLRVQYGKFCRTFFGLCKDWDKI